MLHHLLERFSETEVELSVRMVHVVEVLADVLKAP